MTRAFSETIAVHSATPDQAEFLTRIAIRSKAHWGYSDDFMRAAEAELTVSPESIHCDETHYYVATVFENIIGFYSLENLTSDAIELGSMFIDPNFIGKGVGKLLILHAKSNAVCLGARKLTIQSDPYAKGFYQNAGGKVTGESESGSIPDRFLPTLEIELVDYSDGN